MDLDRNLMRLQGTLSSFSVTTPDSHKLQMLSSLFQNIDETAKTKMVFFLVLNTKMPTTNLLLRDNEFILVTEDTQNLDFPALSYLMFNMDLIGHLGDIVCNSPAALTVELLNGVFPYAHSRLQVRGVEKVIIGLLQKIIKISKGIEGEYSYAYKLWEFMNIFAEMIWCGTAFQSEDLLEEDMNNILGTCLTCVNIYQESTPISYDKTYELKELLEKLNIDEFGIVQPPDCKTRFLKFITKILDLFNDIYNTYFKYDPIESLTAVAENAFTLYEKLQNSDIEPSNLCYLDEIKKKPETEFEKIANSDVNTIIGRIVNSPVPEKWLRALIYCPYLTQTDEAMICLKNHLIYVESPDLLAIAAILQEQFKKNSVSDTLRDLYLCCLNHMPLDDLQFQFGSFFALEKRPNLENPTFDDELRELFNKILVRSDFIRTRLMTFCIRSPVKTIKKICEHAIFNAEQLYCCALDLKMLKAACLLKDISSEENPEVDIISSVLHGMVDNESYAPGEKIRLINLIQRLQKKDSLEVNIEDFILNMIHKEQSPANYDKIELALEILRASIRANSIRSNKIVLLAFFSQLLSRTSWSCSSFKAKLAKLREIIVSNIHTILKNSNYSANDTGLLWLRREIMKTGEINQIHFCELWYSYESELTTSSDLYIQLFTLIHTTTKINSTIDFIVKSFRSQKLLALRISFTAAFIQILPILTYRGWTILMTHVKAIIVSWLHYQKETSDIDVNLVLFRIFTMSLYTLAQDMNQNQDMTLCFSYCLRNFGRMIQENILTDTDLKYEVAVVFVEELLFLLNGIQDSELRKDISITLSPVIFGIVNMAKRNPTGEGSNITDLENWFKKNFIGEVGI